MKEIITILLIAFSLNGFGQIDTESKIKNENFPESWDKNREVRGASEVLAWTHYITKWNNKDFRYCLMVSHNENSSEKLKYTISVKYSDEKPFIEWHYGWIHYGPGPKGGIGYYDVHLKSFDHKPPKEEVYNLINKWGFKFEHDHTYSIEKGIDKKLWMKIFEFEPNAEFDINK